jgi:hypothetical protein
LPQGEQNHFFALVCADFREVNDLGFYLASTVLRADGKYPGRFASRGSLAEAKSFQTQKIAELERHRKGRLISMVRNSQRFPKAIPWKIVEKGTLKPG